MQLPWYSVPEQPFPPRTHRRRKPRQAQSSETSLELPSREQAARQVQEAGVQAVDSGDVTGVKQPNHQHNAALAPPSELETPLTSEAASEIDSTQPTTPASPATPSASRPTSSTAIPRSVSRPAVPIIPATPKVSAVQNKPQADTMVGSSEAEVETSAEPADEETARSSDTTQHVQVDQMKDGTPSTQEPIPRAAPKSWADLVRVPGAGIPAPIAVPVNGTTPAESLVSQPKASSLPEAIRAFSVDSASKASFLEPRGLVNTGNMCYMNSVGIPCSNIHALTDDIG